LIVEGSFAVNSAYCGLLAALPSLRRVGREAKKLSRYLRMPARTEGELKFAGQLCAAPAMSPQAEIR
jgi:hypothetical protein